MVTEVKGSRDETQVLSDYFLYLERAEMGGKCLREAQGHHSHPMGSHP